MRERLFSDHGVQIATDAGFFPDTGEEVTVTAPTARNATDEELEWTKQLQDTTSRQQHAENGIVDISSTSTAVNPTIDPTTDSIQDNSPERIQHGMRIFLLLRRVMRKYRFRPLPLVDHQHVHAVFLQVRDAIPQAVVYGGGARRREGRVGVVRAMRVHGNGVRRSRSMSMSRGLGGGCRRLQGTGGYAARRPRTGAGAGARGSGERAGTARSSPERAQSIVDAEHPVVVLSGGESMAKSAMGSRMEPASHAAPSLPKPSSAHTHCRLPTPSSAQPLCAMRVFVRPANIHPRRPAMPLVVASLIYDMRLTAQHGSYMYSGCLPKVS
ncbi:hypothetical protein BJ912DRAFT_1120518 [Pholiota molesta]|nr:hypothetical protein BJ912DRAFT_1120518 [Pholiota molesta]